MGLENYSGDTSDTGTYEGDGAEKSSTEKATPTASGAMEKAALDALLQPGTEFSKHMKIRPQKRSDNNPRTGWTG